MALRTNRSKIEVRIAAAADVEALTPRLRDAGLMWQDIEPGRSTFFVADGGCVGVEVAGRAALLRSLLVEEARRGKGIARALVAAAESFARSCGATRMFLFSTEAGAYFERLGYVRVAVEETIDSLPTSPQVRFYVAHPDWLEHEVTYCKRLEEPDV